MGRMKNCSSSIPLATTDGQVIRFEIDESDTVRVLASGKEFVVSQRWMRRFVKQMGEEIEIYWGGSDG